MNSSPQTPLPDGSGQAPLQVRRIPVRFPVTTPRLMYALLAINVAIFLYYFRLPVREQILFLLDWGKVNERILDGETYRLFTAMFLHLDLTHMLLNGLALYVFGRDVEMLLGSVRFGVIYLLGGLSGSLASFVFTDGLSVGASGAIFAIFGAEIVYLYHHRTLHGPGGQRLFSRLLLFMVLELAIGFVGASGIGEFRIDQAGHVGGLVGGIVLTWFIGPAYRIARDVEHGGELSVVDENPLRRWAPYAALYALLLLVITTYAISV